MTRFVLASASPRRRELLMQAGLAFEILPAQGEEVSTKEQPAKLVEDLSYNKAVEVAERCKENHKSDTTVIIGADTVVALGNEIMGKPKDYKAATAMLTKLQGTVHQVYTGVTLVVTEGGTEKQAPQIITFHEKTNVCMYPMTPEQIAAYVATGEPMDKAGAYGIQGIGGRFVEGIKGDYQNVVGLPLAKLYQVLKKIDEIALPF